MFICFILGAYGFIAQESGGVETKWDFIPTRGSVWTGRSDKKHKLHVLRYMFGASVFIATKQWCKDKVRLCRYKRECLDTALLVGTSR